MCAGSLFEVTESAVQRSVSAESVESRVVDRRHAGVAVQVRAELIAERWEPWKTPSADSAVPTQRLLVAAQLAPRYLPPAV